MDETEEKNDDVADFGRLGKGVATIEEYLLRGDNDSQGDS